MGKIDEIYKKLLRMHQEPLEGKDPEELRREVFEILDCLVFTNVQMGRQCLDAKRDMDPREYRDYLAREGCPEEVATAAMNLFLRQRAGASNSSLYAEAIELAVAYSDARPAGKLLNANFTN